MVVNKLFWTVAIVVAAYVGYVALAIVISIAIFHWFWNGLS